MTEPTFTPDQRAGLVNRVKAYFEQELEQDIGGFDAEFLIDFLAREIGPYYYNQGLADAHGLLSEKLDELGYQIQELEKPVV